MPYISLQEGSIYMKYLCILLIIIVTCCSCNNDKNANNNLNLEVVGSPDVFSFNKVTYLFTNEIINPSHTGKKLGTPDKGSIHRINCGECKAPFIQQNSELFEIKNNKSSIAIKVYDKYYKSDIFSESK